MAIISNRQRICSRDLVRPSCGLARIESGAALAERLAPRQHLGIA